MRASNNHINRQQQVKVVIRLKPQPLQSRHRNCVSLSEQNQLLVETDYKKQIFVFDHVAHPKVSQEDVYEMMGSEMVAAGLEGYNCCIFAYGQTGAGKTYSIMGDINELQRDNYSPGRGILPRLLQEIFTLAYREEGTHQITCSYIEIYNEQIYDLLSDDKRAHHIREDGRRGVFVEGVVEKRPHSYQQAVGLLLEGDQRRRTAFTNMNQESSRSHSCVKEQGVVKSRKSKINIVDLAGSQRVKYTGVEGQRLRQASSINKSLHVLGNVINSLVQSAKKKKYIPYRDSKLTYYLKDSLGGNSITKLLANIHCNRQYYGDTLSTLMFAKRAKILKMRVEVNQNVAGNYQQLRKEVKRLREELAEAKYFRDVQKTQRSSFYQQFQQTLQKVTDNSDYEVSPKVELLQVFQQNQLHYKSLMAIYEEHMSTCLLNDETVGTGKRRGSVSKFNEWKNVEKKNVALSALVSRFPAFTRIYKQNVLLKQERLGDKMPTKRTAEETTFIAIKQPQNMQIVELGAVQQVVKYYQTLIDELKTTFTVNLQTLEKSFEGLEHQLKIKQYKIKQLVDKQNLPPDIEELRNENEYLQLNVMNLQNEIQQLKGQINKGNIEKKQMKKISHRRSICERDGQGNEDHQQFVIYINQKLAQIKREAEKQNHIAEQQRQQLLIVIKQLNTNVSSLMNQNNRLQLRTARSGSQHKSRQKNNPMFKSYVELTSSPKKTLIDLCPPNQSEFLRTNATSEQFKVSGNTFTKEMMTLKLELRAKEKEVVDLKGLVQDFESGDQKLQDQFGKPLDQIIKQYRQILKKQTSPISYTKTMKSIGKYKQQDPINVMYIENKLGNSRKASVQMKAKDKQSMRSAKKEDVTQSNLYTSHYNSKRNFFSNK